MRRHSFGLKLRDSFQWGAANDQKRTISSGHYLAMLNLFSNIRYRENTLFEKDNSD